MLHGPVSVSPRISTLSMVQRRTRISRSQRLHLEDMVSSRQFRRRSPSSVRLCFLRIIRFSTDYFALVGVQVTRIARRTCIVCRSQSHPQSSNPLGAIRPPLIGVTSPLLRPPNLRQPEHALTSHLRPQLQLANPSSPKSQMLLRVQARICSSVRSCHYHLSISLYSLFSRYFMYWE